MSKVILEGKVIDHWKVKATYPRFENITIRVDIGGETKVVFTDINSKTSTKNVRNFYNVNLILPKYVGVKNGQKIKIEIED